jgi:hypothetical protein
MRGGLALEIISIPLVADIEVPGEGGELASA